MPSIKLTDTKSAEIVDPDNVLPVYADVITELRMADGVLNLSLATLVVAGFGAEATHDARVCARLRISPGALQLIQKALAAPHDKTSPPSQKMN